jgi:hypothetical protein
LLARRFVSDESWTKATTQDGSRYLGMFREYEPDLAAVLKQPLVLVLGEPGAGKSMTAQAARWQVLDSGQGTPISASLKSYQGNLRELLDKSAPPTVLDDTTVVRTYILDGVDEIPRDHLTTLKGDLQNLIANDTTGRILLTSRQAYAAQHRNALPDGLKTFHLLDFADDDIKAYVKEQGTDPDTFLAAVRAAACEDEITNPFVLGSMLQRYNEHGDLSPIRSDNVAYVVSRLIETRPTFNAARQRRALRMLATACETAARNELTQEESKRVLLEAIDIPAETAAKLLDELAHSILIRTTNGISFQMRSYGEFLAAEELHDKGVDRLRELAFTRDAPIDTWLNTITYLAEMSDKARQYFARQYPDWLINVSPAAFTQDERTDLTTELLRRTNEAGAYLIDNRGLSLRRLARLLTPSVIATLREQLASDKPHEAANALVLLGILREPGIASQALPLVVADRNPSPRRYAALVALINTGDSAVVDDLIRFADPTDPYHINIIDAIGSLCTPAQFPQVLPLLQTTNAGLSSAYYHFRELKSREALDATIAYLTRHPAILHGFAMDSYLEPILAHIPSHWDATLAESIGRLLAAIENAHVYCQREKLITAIIMHTTQHDNDAIAVQTMLAAFPERLTYTDHVIAPLINNAAAQWITTAAPQHAEHLFFYLPPGPARDLLDPRTPDAIKAQEQALAEQLAQQREHEQQEATTRGAHQATIRTNRNLYDILNAFVRLPKEHYPEIGPDQRERLAQHVGLELTRLDLARTVVWQSANTWTHPPALEPLLAITDYYKLTIQDDVPIILALRSWTNEEIANYYRDHGLSARAQATLVDLLRSTENENIPRHAISFLRQTGHHNPAIEEALLTIATDTTRPALRTEAIERLASIAPNHDAFVALANDQDPRIREQAFRHLIAHQHEPTIRRSLATLTDAQLQAGEVPVPETTDLNWIGKITAPFALDDLRGLRGRALERNLWSVTNLITNTIANIDKNRAAAIIQEQLRNTPAASRQHWTQEAEKLRREARIQAAQQTPFDTVIRKLKGATSMIHVKVWCEGDTDRPVFHKLLIEAGENGMAATLDFVGGWGNFLVKEPERWLDGCRHAVVILDGDVGRNLKKRGKPYTTEGKRANQLCKSQGITLHILQRYGIENYFPKHACEAVLHRNLTTYFPIPDHKAIEKHFSEPRTWWRVILDRINKRSHPSFYQKRLSEHIAAHLTIADVQGTDLVDIINDLKTKGAQARLY